MGELQVFSVGDNGEHTFLDLQFFSHPGLVFHSSAFWQLLFHSYTPDMLCVVFLVP